MEQKDLMVLAQNIAFHLPGWVPRSVQRFSHLVDLQHVESKMMISISTEQHNKEKLVIKGYVPDPYRVVEYGIDNHKFWVGTMSIGVSAKKEGAAIAKDIQRRLLPDYERNFQDRYKQSEEMIDYNKEVEGRRKDLQEKFPGKFRQNRNDSDQFSFYIGTGTPYGHVKTSNVTCNMEINCLPYEKAMRILEIVMEGS